MVIRHRHILHEDLSDDADLRNLALHDRNPVELADHVAAVDMELPAVDLILRQVVDADIMPLLEQRVGGSRNGLVRAHAVDDFHQDVAVHHGLQDLKSHLHGVVHARVLLHAARIDRNDRNLRIAHVLQGLPDKADVVRRTAAASGLDHEDRQLIHIVLTRSDLIQDLSRDDHGRVAGVVIYILHAHVQNVLALRTHQHHVIAAGPHGRLEEVEMRLDHAVAQDRVLLVLHLLGVELPLVVRDLPLAPLRKTARDTFPQRMQARLRGRSRFLRFSLPHADGRDHRADADARRAEVIYLVDLQQRVELPDALENLFHLVDRDRVQAAAERVQLDQLQVVAFGDHLRGVIKACVIRPLVRGADLHEVVPVHRGNAVLGQYREPETSDGLRDAVIDLRVHMIRASRENDAVGPVLGDPVQRSPSFPQDVILRGGELVPAGRDRFLKLLLSDPEGLLHERSQRLGQDLAVCERDKRIVKLNVLLPQALHVIPDALRIGNDHRAVKGVLLGLRLAALVIHAGIKDPFDAVFDQPFHVSVGQLRGIALGFARDAVHAERVDFRIRERRNDHREAQLPEEDRPEREILVHVQNARDADHAAGRFFGRQRFIAEHALLFKRDQVRNVRRTLLAGNGLLAAVSGDVALSVRKAVDRQAAAVLASAAVSHGRLERKLADALLVEHRRVLALEALPRDQSRAERAHKARDIRADRLCAGDQLEAAQDGIVIECAALDHDFLAEV